MKKISLIIFIYLISLLALPLAAQAKTCSWNMSFSMSGDFIYNYTCSDYKLYDAFDSDCQEEKPNSSFICCCNEKGMDISQPVSQVKESKFKAPDLQIPIDTVDLSDVVCQVDENGDRSCSIPWIGQYISGIYQYAISIAGILAAVVLMAGGVLWLVSGGDSGRISKAKEMIIGSVSGLVILMASYIILYQINPNLVRFGGISVGEMGTSAVDTEPASDYGNPESTTDCNNCIEITQVPCKDGRLATVTIVEKLNAAYAASPPELGWRVTEAWPPTDEHKSKCHYNGNCVDVAIYPQDTANCTRVHQLISILKAAGLQVLNEYTGCAGVYTPHSTAGHLHVQ